MNIDVLALKKLLEETNENLKKFFEAESKGQVPLEPQSKNSTRDLDQRLGELRAAILGDYEINKYEWPAGIWDYEHNLLTWKDEDTGYYCCIKRHPRKGHLCGYVALPASHPYYGNSDDGIELDDEPHGGITYVHDEVDDVMITKGAFWWFGFDCAHYGDYAPNGDAPQGTPCDDSANYRDMNYVIDEVEKLAKELKAREESLFQRQLNDLVTSARYYVNKEHIVHVLGAVLEKEKENGK